MPSRVLRSGQVKLTATKAVEEPVMKRRKAAKSVKKEEDEVENGRLALFLLNNADSAASTGEASPPIAAKEEPARAMTKRVKKEQAVKQEAEGIHFVLNPNL